MIFSSILFAVMGYFAKLASFRIPGPEVALVRFGFGVATGLVLAAFKKINLRTGNRRLLIARGTFGGTAILLYFLALSQGSLTNSTILNNTYPIFSTLIAAFYLHESLSLVTGLSLAVSWIGVGLLIHPDFHRIFVPDLIALVSGVLSGVAVVVVRELRRDNEPAWNVFFYLSIFGTMISLFFAIPVWVWPGTIPALYLLATAVFGLAAQLIMTYSYKYCSASLGGILSMTTMVFASFIGIFALGEKLSAGEFWGALLIISGSIVVVWFTSNSTKENVSIPNSGLPLNESSKNGAPTGTP